jgi:hypothetical protein
MATEIDFRTVPLKIDGVSQETAVPELGFRPEGVLEHKYYGPDLVVLHEVGNDLLYSTDYWAIERYWKTFLTKQIYERLIMKFLNGVEVVVSYVDPKKPKVYLPRDDKIDGFTTMYREVVNELKTMSGYELEEHLSNIGYDPIFGAADYYLGR